jgi:HD-GYP domain-containing protein (c-di-GMP phosphodiesterase class II)
MNIEAQNDLARKITAEIEAHNPARKGHGEQVSSLAVGTGYELGIRDDALRILRYAALLHDVWKLEFPHSLLERSGALDEGERSALRKGPSVFVQRHTLGIEGLSTAIESQFEYWDGTGSPLGLAGNEIPLASRIISVCVAFQVMTSEQPWRKALPESEALAKLVRGAGKQFDPAVVAAFIKIQPLIQPTIIDV